MWAGGPIGSGDRQPVLPDGAVDLVGRPPLLRGEIENEGGIGAAAVFSFEGLHQLPAVGRIGLVDVAIESRLGLQGGSEVEKGDEKGEEGTYSRLHDRDLQAQGEHVSRTQRL